MGSLHRWCFPSRHPAVPEGRRVGTCGVRSRTLRMPVVTMFRTGHFWCVCVCVRVCLRVCVCVCNLHLLRLLHLRRGALLLLEWIWSRAPRGAGCEAGLEGLFGVSI